MPPHEVFRPRAPIGLWDTIVDIDLPQTGDVEADPSQVW